MYISFQCEKVYIQQPEHLAIIGSNQIAVKFAGSMTGFISGW
ncbi:hypothetical protein [Dulcicalothrix desertica]|nr:hypothetical protein [Dulcicalothrix desertica]TWH54896.1 hypothetical protein CAL7102_02979 [Dulcicalothrix desertica PCC 7102]